MTKPINIRYKSACIDAPNTPRYGLSYTTFEYSDLKISCLRLRSAETTQMQFTLTNTGKVAGEEVAQLYVAAVARPLKELKDFQKITIEPGESRVLTFTIDKNKLAYYNSKLKWATEPGDFNVLVGNASDDIRLKSKLRAAAVAAVARSSASRYKLTTANYLLILYKNGPLPRLLLQLSQSQSSKCLPYLNFH